MRRLQMGILHSFFKKKKPVLMRCTHCYEELYLSPKEVRSLETKNSNDPVCPIKQMCHICHIGFSIPVKYSNNSGKVYLFHQIKPKIKNLDPDTVMQRILDNHDNETVMFFSPFD